MPAEAVAEVCWHFRGGASSISLTHSFCHFLSLLLTHPLSCLSHSHPHPLSIYHSYPPYLSSHSHPLSPTSFNLTLPLTHFPTFLPPTTNKRTRGIPRQGRDSGAAWQDAAGREVLEVLLCVDWIYRHVRVDAGEKISRVPSSRIFGAAGLLAPFSIPRRTRAASAHPPARQASIHFQHHGFQ